VLPRDVLSEAEGNQRSSWSSASICAACTRPGCGSVSSATTTAGPAGSSPARESGSFPRRR